MDLEDPDGALLYIWSPNVSVCVCGGAWHSCLPILPAHLLLAKQLGSTVSHLWPYWAWG